MSVQPSPSLQAQENHRIRLDQLKAFPENQRLKKIRQDILDSGYHLCTQKASLMTDYMKRNDPQPKWLEPLRRVHYGLYGNSMKKAAKGMPQRTWQIAANNLLNRFYQRCQPFSPSENQLCFAKAFRHILDNMELKVYDQELIVGNPSSHRVGAPIHPELGGLLMLPEIERLDTRPNNPIPIDAAQRRELKEEIFPFWFNRSVLAFAPLYTKNPELFSQTTEGCYFILTQFAGISHVTPDYPRVLRMGFNGIKEKIRHHLDRMPDTRGNRATEERRAFYEAALITAEAAIAYGKRWSRHLTEQAAAEKNPERGAELAALADMFRRIPAEPAATFYEAVQSLFITHVMVHGENFQHGVSFGRVDQYLYPYYIKDLETGILTTEKALEILGCFIAKAGELIPLFFDRATEFFSGLSSASGLTLGGCLPDGSDGVNELSYLFLHAYDQVRLRQPNFHVRVHRDTPAPFLTLCADVLKKGGGLPAFFNDEQVATALVNSGFQEDDAADYSIVGCVEWGVPGKSFPAAGAVFINLPMALHLALHNGKFGTKAFGPPTGTALDFQTMDDIIGGFTTQLRHMLAIAAEGNDAIEKAHARHRPTPFLSTLVEGCIERGIEVNNGGAIYGTVGCQGVGLADVADSLSAMDELVFRKKRLSLAEMLGAVDSNYEGREDIRQLIANKTSKYGINRVEADRWARIVSGIYTRAVFRHKSPRGGPYLGGFWSMTTHQGFGVRTPALPSGRKAGETLANGISSVNGRDRLGPTAAMASAAKIDSGLIGNGCALNMKINPDQIQGEEGSRLLRWLIRGYFDMGGCQVQFNIIDPAILIDAREHPEKYRDLVVRVSGYSAYFNDLTDAMKDELIDRTLHSSRSLCGC